MEREKDKSEERLGTARRLSDNCHFERCDSNVIPLNTGILKPCASLYFDFRRNDKMETFSDSLSDIQNRAFIPLHFSRFRPFVL